MSTKILLADLFPLRSSVELVEGQPAVPVRPLRFDEVVSLLFKHGDALFALYNASQQKNAVYEPFLASVPNLVVDVICLGADMEDQREDVKVLPPGPQLQLLAAVWELSVPDPKKLLESLSKLMAQAQRLVAANKSAAATAPAAGSQNGMPSSLPENAGNVT